MNLSIYDNFTNSITIHIIYILKWPFRPSRLHKTFQLSQREGYFNALNNNILSNNKISSAKCLQHLQLLLSYRNCSNLEMTSKQVFLLLILKYKMRK